MKPVRIVFGIIAAFVLLGGGFAAGTAISQARAVNLPAPQFVRPTLAVEQPVQPTVVPQQQVQTTPAPLQGQPAPTIPPQGQWGPGWWMMNPDNAPQGQYNPDWMMNPNYTPRGQQSWGMDGWEYDDWGDRYDGWGNMHGGMMGNWGRNGQGYPSGYSTPGAPAPQPTTIASTSFKNDVQPVFAARCTSCHGGTAGLYLDTYENVLKGGKNGAVIVPGDVNNSRLAYYIYSGYMPYGGPALSQAEIQTILNWIAAGAPDN